MVRGVSVEENECCDGGRFPIRLTMNIVMESEVVPLKVVRGEVRLKEFVHGEGCNYGAIGLVAVEWKGRWF